MRELVKSIILSTLSDRPESGTEPAMPVIGYLESGVPELSARRLSEAGYVEGR
jgi:hypothetical protein